MPEKTAVLYRISHSKHICPFGLRAKDLLKKQGFEIEEHLLNSKQEAEALKAEYGVATTPQIFIGDERVGGFSDLQDWLGLAPKDTGKPTYTPVIAIFATTALMALALNWALWGSLMSLKAVEWFIAFSMCVLGIQKLRDLDGFANQFITYDLLAMRHLNYAYVYPFAEVGAGILMIAGALSFISVPVALFIAGINGVSVFKAVYMDQRSLKCACVGGASTVPLGFVSLLENIMMVLMALWMAFRYWVFA